MEARAAAPSCHPAWEQLTWSENDALSWRRAACRNAAAVAPCELMRGGVLALLQSEHRLAVPEGTRGALNAYIHSTAELSAAVRAHLSTTIDAFYGRCPDINANYGGKGASQQLWWCGDKGWKVTQPNRHMLKFLDAAPPRHPKPEPVDTARGGGKRQRRVDRVDEEAPTTDVDDSAISPDEIHLLPLVEMPSSASLSEQQAEAMFAELQRKGWLPSDLSALGAASGAGAGRSPQWDIQDSSIDTEGGWSSSDGGGGGEGGASWSWGESDSDTESTSGWGSEDSSEPSILVPIVELEDEGEGLSLAILLEEVECLPPSIRAPLGELESSNEIVAEEAGATHERQAQGRKLQDDSRAYPVNAMVTATQKPTAKDGSRLPPPAAASGNLSAVRALVSGSGDGAPHLRAKLVVPIGATPGQTLKVQLGDRAVGVVVPPGARGGQKLRIDSSSPSAAATVTASNATVEGAGRREQRQVDAADGVETLGAVIATIVGFVGFFVALFMFHRPGVVAIVSGLASTVILWHLNRQLTDREENRPLTEDEDALMALGLVLPHIAVAVTVELFTGSIVLFVCQILLHAALGGAEAWYLISFGARYRGGVEADTPHGGYLCWLGLTCVPIAVLLWGFAVWEPAACFANGPSGVSVECLDDMATFTRVAGCGLMVMAVALSQASNRGSLAVVIMPVVSLVCLLWGADLGRGTALGCPSEADCASRVTPLAILPVLATFVSGVNLFVRSKSKWTEATTSALSFSILGCQTISAITEGMNLQLIGHASEDVLGAASSTGSLSQEGFSEAATFLWLTQFIFLPVVFFGRAALPVLPLMLGSGILVGDLPLLGLPVATLVGIVVIKATPTASDVLTSLELPGFGVEDSDEDEQEGDGPDNRDRVAVCAYLTPCLAAGYVISSWVMALTTLGASNGSSAVLDDDSRLPIRLSAATGLCVCLLGCAHLVLHKSIKPGVAPTSIAAAAMLTAGAWLDEQLTLPCMALWIPALLGARFVHAKHLQQFEDGTVGVFELIQTRDAVNLVHAVCSAVLFVFICFRALPWQHAWCCLCLLYVLCWTPLSTTVAQLHAQEVPKKGTALRAVPLKDMRLWRPGVIGPLCCAAVAAFWTVEDGGMVCDANFGADQCNESWLYQVFLLVPILIILLEFASDEICAAGLTDRFDPGTTRQQARTSAMLLVAASGVPFRLWLEVAQTRGQAFFYQTSCLNSTSAREGHPDWCSFLPIDVPERKIAGQVFTAIISGTCLLMYILCGASRQTNNLGRLIGQTDPLFAERLKPVPPTQGMAAAMLCLAFLDYHTPIMAAPLCLASSYTSYVAYWCEQHNGSWPTAMLAGPLIWLLKSGLALFRDDEKARWGVVVFGIAPSEELTVFIDHFPWMPMMAVFLIAWGGFVRTNLVTTWPDDTEQAEFSWEKLFYCVDAVVFYAAVLMMAELSRGWVCVIVCTLTVFWGFYRNDETVVLRLPALYLVTFLIIESYQADVNFGAWAFFATAVACLIAAVLTHIFLGSRADDAEAHQKNPSGIVDLTLLWAFLAACLDGAGGFSQGGLAFALTVVLPAHCIFRGYPFLLGTTPLVMPLALNLYLANLSVEDEVYRDTASAFAGSINGLALVVMSIVGISPVGGDAVGLFALFADDDEDFILVSDSGTLTTWFMRRTPVTMESYHLFLLWAGTCWIYVWAIVGLFWTKISIEGALAFTIAIGSMMIAVGERKNSVNLRMTGLLQLCFAILLGALAPGIGPTCLATYEDTCAGTNVTGAVACAIASENSDACEWSGALCQAADLDACESVWSLQGSSACSAAGQCGYDQGNDLLRVVLILVGSFFACGWAVLYCNAGCCCNCTLKETTSGEIRPSTVMSSRPTVVDATIKADKAGRGNGSKIILNPIVQGDPDCQTEPTPEDTRSPGLRAAETAYFAALTNDSPGSAGFTDDQAALVSARISAAAQIIRRQTTIKSRMVTVATERLNIRQAPSADATILRKVPRGAKLEVVGGLGAWLELGSREAHTADQLAQGAGWILGRGDGASRALVE